MITALISALANAGGLLSDKIALSRQRISLNVFIPLVFMFLFIFSLVLVPFFGRVDWPTALLSNSLFLLLLMVIVAVAWNSLYYQSIQHEKVHQHELIMMTAPLMTVLLAAVFFPEDFNIKIFGLALVSGVALLFAKGQKEHFTFSKTSYNLILAVILMSVESILIRELLFSYSPVALYTVRTLFIAIFFALYYRPRYRQVSAGHKALVAFSGLIGVVEMITRYYAFDSLGVIYTSLVMMLGPIIIFYLSWEVLHEHIRPRVVVASVIILICVALATVIKFG